MPTKSKPTQAEDSKAAPKQKTQRKVTPKATPQPDGFHSAVLCLPVEAIDVEDRTRNDHGQKNTNDDINVFAQRLRDEGQINPITFEVRDGGRRVLNTGFRRWAAAGLLASRNEFFGMALPEGSPRRVSGPGFILCRDMATLTEIERLVLELTENINRKQFTAGEEALGYAKLKKLLEQDSLDKTGVKKTVTVTDLAAITKRSIGQIGMGLKVASRIESTKVDPKLRKAMLNAPSVKAAHEKMRSEDKLAEIKKRIAKGTQIPKEQLEAIEHEDGLAFLKALPSASVDFINFDPPWGIGIDEYDRRRKYEDFNDDPEYAWTNIITPMLPELYRVLKPDTWSIVWFGQQFYERMVQALEKLHFEVNPVPYVWFKTNKSGATGDSSKIEMNVYEVYLRIRKGDPRLFRKPNTNVLSYPMDRGDERTHFAQKNVDLMVDILERYTFSGMFVIDPTYGSGTFFKAAKRLGRIFAGAEKNPKNRADAKLLLQRPE